MLLEAFGVGDEEPLPTYIPNYRKQEWVPEAMMNSTKSIGSEELPSE